MSLLHGAVEMTWEGHGSVAEVWERSGCPGVCPSSDWGPQVHHPPQGIALMAKSWPQGEPSTQVFGLQMGHWMMDSMVMKSSWFIVCSTGLGDEVLKWEVTLDEGHLTVDDEELECEVRSCGQAAQ